MVEVTIEVKGAGATIHHEIYAIADMLKEKGYKVDIDDEHAPKDIKEYGKDYEGKNVTKHVKIIAKHLPWGG